jgi:hypothetical protein
LKAIAADPQESPASFYHIDLWMCFDVITIVAPVPQWTDKSAGEQNSGNYPVLGNRTFFIAANGRILPYPCGRTVTGRQLLFAAVITIERAVTHCRLPGDMMVVVCRATCMMGINDVAKMHQQINVDNKLCEYKRINSKHIRA